MLFKNMSEILNISELFSSIQGESTLVGTPCTFIRFAGCNLRCSYCDTRYAYEVGREVSVASLLDAVDSLGMPLVEITGGEPLIQKGVHTLVKSLLDKGYRVMIETNGSQPIQELDPRVLVVMDIKTPGSSESASLELDNFKALKPEDNLKFVLTSEHDYLWARSMIYDFSFHKKCRVLLSAVFGELEYKSLAEWILRDRLPARLNVQIHKHIWPSVEVGGETRGR